MKKQFLSTILCTIILFIQVFAQIGVVHAEGQVDVFAELDNTMLSFIDGRPFVAPLGKFRMEYQISNASIQPIGDIEIVEELTNKNNNVISHSFSLDEELQPGEMKTLKGRLYTGEVEGTPYKLKYYIRYKNTNDGQRQETSGQKEIGVINTALSVKYSTQHEGPAFKGEQVALTAEVESKANLTLYNIVVYDSVLGELGRIDALAPGTAAKVEKTIALDKTTEGHIRLVYDDPMGLRENISQEYSNNSLKIEVKDEAPVASLTFTGTPDKKMIPGQSSVNINLVLRNTGNTTLTNIECLDKDGAVFHTYEKLLPQEEITVQYTGVAEPGVSYDILAQGLVEGTSQIIQSSYTVQMDKLNQGVEINRTFEPETVVAGKPFSIRYVIRNIGNVALKDIVIDEPAFGEVGSFDLLEPGREYDFTKELTIDKPTVSKPVLKAVDVEMDAEYTFEASELDIPLQASGEKRDLSMALLASQTSLKKPGTIEMEVLVKNTGIEPLYNLVFKLMDREISIDNIAVMEPGEEKTIKITPFRLEETETFFVQVSGIGAGQEGFTMTSDPLTIEVGSSQSGRDSILKVILVIIVLLSIFVAGALAYLIRGTLKNKYRRKRKITRTRSI